MGRNRIAVDKPAKKADNFFNKTQNVTKTKSKFEQKPSKITKEFLKPSVSGSEDFFVKPSKSSDLKVSVRSEIDGPVSETLKKTFDKKKYRLQKYSKKYKVQQWEDRRKKAVLRDYYKTVKDEPKLDVERIYKDYSNEDSDGGKINEENENNLNSSITDGISVRATTLSNDKKLKPFQRAQKEFQRLKEEKQKKREEFLQVKAEKEKALQKYKKEKAEKYKKLSRKTKKGQPIMKERMEMLLEKIQNSLK